MPDKRKRGRPPKNATRETQSINQLPITVEFPKPTGDGTNHFGKFIGSAACSAARRHVLDSPLKDRRGEEWDFRRLRKSRFQFQPFSEVLALCLLFGDSGGDSGGDLGIDLGADMEEMEGHYLISFINIFLLCYKLRIRGEARNVLDWLCAHIVTHNIVRGASHKRIGEDCGMAQPNVSKALKKLESLTIIIREHRGEVLVNPYYFFLGDPPSHAIATRRWDRLFARRKEELMRRLTEELEKQRTA